MRYKTFNELTDFEEDIGFLDHDMENISYHNGGYDILNNDIMILQDQITPLFVHDKTNTKIDHY